MLLLTAIVLVVLVLVGAIILWIVLANRNHQTESRLRAEQLAAELNRRTAALERAEAERERLRDEGAKLQYEIAALRTRLEDEERNSREKLALLTSAREELSNQFKSLANDILEEKSKRFTQQNQENLGQLIAPLREKFGDFQQKVESLEKEGVAGRTELKTQIEQLRSLNERLSEDATNLVSALRGSSKAQGEWGEVVLERILESSGLRRDHEYRVQETIFREDGRRARLDIIIDLPEGRHLVLDSKVSLNDYSDYCSAGDDTVRDAALARHLASVAETHTRALAAQLRLALRTQLARLRGDVCAHRAGLHAGARSRRQAVAGGVGEEHLAGEPQHPALRAAHGCASLAAGAAGKKCARYRTARQ